MVSWEHPTALGLLIGPVVPESWQLDFAIPLMFMVLVIAGIDRYPKVVAALAAAAATYLTIGLPNRVGLLVGGVVGVAAGVIAERMRR